MGVKSTIDWVKAKAILYHIGRGSMAAAADYLAARAVDYAPVDTGFLASHIMVYAREDSIAAQVVSTAFYSQWIEFGHMTPGGTFVAPNPFMQKAMADTIREFPEIVRQVAIATPLANGSADPHLTVSIAF